MDRIRFTPAGTCHSVNDYSGGFCTGGVYGLRFTVYCFAVVLSVGYFG